MSFWLHSTILATTLAASIAVGVAAAYDGVADPLAAKGDRLPLAAPPAASFVTVEASENGVSVLRRIPLVGGYCHD
jgi:hypothetical protein